MTETTSSNNISRTNFHENFNSTDVSNSTIFIKEPWFIGLVLAVALIAFILLIVYLLTRESGAKYSVQEKEPLQEKIVPSETQGFDEYQKEVNEQVLNQTEITVSLPNVCFDPKQFHNEEDSMAEYGNGENDKFNEDGSFIGLYGQDKMQSFTV